MKYILSLTLAAVAALFSGCATGGGSGGSYKVTAYRPNNPSAVKVKVSTSTQHIYVMEGDRLLMAVQGCVVMGFAGLCGVLVLRARAKV